MNTAIVIAPPGPATQHPCRQPKIVACQCCRMPTHTRFLATGFCPACRLAMVKAELDEMVEAEASEPILTDDELDEYADAWRDHMDLGQYH